MHGFISITNIMSYNLINLILTTNKLIKPNYVDWKRNLDIILNLEEPKWLTQEIVPSTPNEIPLRRRRTIIIVCRRQIKRASVLYLDF